jgi:hypothetical protein
VCLVGQKEEIPKKEKYIDLTWFHVFDKFIDYLS